MRRTADRSDHGQKYKYSSEMLTQYTIAMASFKLQNPDNKDENAAQLAGLESVVKAYRAILRTKPKTATAGMDALSGSGQRPTEESRRSCGLRERQGSTW